MMMSFFNRNNEKKRDREIELVERSVMPILPLMTLSIDTVFSLALPDIVDNLARIPSFDLLPNIAIPHYIPTHLNTQPVPMLRLDLNHLIHTNIQLNINNVFFRRSNVDYTINEQLLATLFAIKSAAKKLPIHFVMEIALYLFPRLTDLKDITLCAGILDNNESEPPPHPNYILV